MVTYSPRCCFTTPAGALSRSFHAWLETAQSWLSPRVLHKRAASGEGAHAHSVSVVFGGHRVVGTLCEAKLMETLMETLELIETFQAATPRRYPEDSSYSSQ
jgi:hypothetical protein